MKRWFGYATCFLTGFIVLVLELVCFRLFAPYFGTSTYVIGVVLNIILLGLALGYLAGGFLADKHADEHLPYLIILISGVYVLLVYLFSAHVLDWLSSLSVLVGSSLAILLLFFIPMLLLASVPPYIIKLFMETNKEGRISGMIFSLGTLGSLLGGALTTFFFIPELGSRATVLLCAGMLFLLALVGLWKRSKLFSATILLLLIPPLSLPHDPLAIYQAESEYNEIKVVELLDVRLLQLHDSKGFHSISLNNQHLTGFYYDHFLLGPLLVPGKHALILGNGAGTSMAQYSYFYSMPVDAVELDSMLTDVGKEYFGFVPGENVHIFHDDARRFLLSSTKRYDIIVIDLYSADSYVPFHLATAEFYSLMAEHLTDDGIAMINLPQYAKDSELWERYLSTIQQSFPTLFISGQVLFAFKKDVSSLALKERYAVAVQAVPSLKDVTSPMMAGLEPVHAEGKVFTDDVAPIERMTFDVLRH